MSTQQMETNGQETTNAPVNVSVVLDRSGSMHSIADDVVGGFQRFLQEQREAEGDIRISLVQFDGEDPFEILIDGEDLKHVSFDASRYQPRASTPLLDAVGRMIARIDAGVAERKQHQLPEEDQIVLVITDGLENASKEYTLAAVKGLIDARMDAGWTFVFLGADQDAFAEGRRYGFSEKNRRNWEKSKRGTDEMWSSVSKSTTAYRSKASYLRRREADDFFEDGK